VSIGTDDRKSKTRNTGGMNFHLSTEQEQAMDQLLTVFLEENTKLNLSALRTKEACSIGNIDDSLAFLAIVPTLLGDTHASGSPLSLIDIGTGGGFPLLPLAIALPHWQLHGLDSTAKKIAAIERIAEAMGIRTIQLHTGRAETAGHEQNMREQFDVVTARAVAKIPELLEYCSAFVKPGGHIVLWKSIPIDKEITSATRAQRILHCRPIHVHSYELAGDFGRRQLLIFQKEGRLAARYPRTIGEPKKDPLI